MPDLLITGANRGIGLEFVRSFAADGWAVHACCRRPDKAKQLNAVEGAVIRNKLDVTDGLQVASLARAMIDTPLDILINNAGVYGERVGFGETDYDAWLDVFKVNALAPMRMVERFVDHVEKSERKLIVNISSRMGSIADNMRGGSHVYRSSKAALNMITKGLANDLAPRGITVVSFHPGWVQTDMGGENALISTTESVAAMRKAIERITPEDTGSFFNYDGSPLPW